MTAAIRLQSPQMDVEVSPRSARTTLILCTILHAFTHAYGTILVPLYLLIVADLHLSGVRAAALIVTAYGLVYNLGSYASGTLADRVDRRLLLGIGLIGNAAAITAMGFTHSYALLLLLGACAGVFGTLFHPNANALIPALYPKNPGMAIGLLGMGSGLGFFVGPQFSGWRAHAARWQFDGVADWQRPCVELGALGMAFGIVWLLAAVDPRHSRRPGAIEQQAMLPGRLSIEAVVTDLRGAASVHDHRRLSSNLRNRIIAIAAVLGCRDFAGVASPSLLSVFLQKAHGFTTAQAGFVIGGMMLLSILISPLAVFVSRGFRRLPTLAVALILGGVTMCFTPFVSAATVLPLMALFQCFSLGSYAISDAAILERVAPSIRGRVVGLFLTLAGTLAASSPWVMGFWTDALRGRAGVPQAYFPIFAVLGALMMIASGSTPLIARLREASVTALDLSPQPALAPRQT